MLTECTRGSVFPIFMRNRDFSVIRLFSPGRRACICEDQSPHAELSPWQHRCVASHRAGPVCESDVPAYVGLLVCICARGRGRRARALESFLFLFSLAAARYGFAFSTRSANNFLFAVGRTVIFYFGWKLIAP